MIATSFYIHGRNDKKKSFEIGYFNETAILSIKLDYSTMSTHFTVEELKDLKEKIDNFLLDH